MNDIKLTKKKIKTTIERVTKNVIEKQVEASIDIYPDSIHIAISPWQPFEMRCPYDKKGG